jgi:protein MpaA
VANPELLAGVTLVLMPVVNPDGVESGKRYNARGVDLNRNFPAENRHNSSRYGLNALSEPEALAIYQVINDTLPNHIVTLHEPLQCVDYDGPAKELATVMSEFCPLPVKKLGSRPGSLGSYAGVTLGIPTITFELPRNAATQSPKFLWRFYGEALIQAVLHRHAANE